MNVASDSDSGCKEYLPAAAADTLALSYLTTAILVSDITRQRTCVRASSSGRKRSTVEPGRTVLLVLRMRFAGSVVMLVVLGCSASGTPHLALLLNALQQQFKSLGSHFVHAEPVLVGDTEFG